MRVEKTEESGVVQMQIVKTKQTAQAQKFVIQREE